LHSCPRERRSGFGVFPQNAKKLGIHFPNYLQTVTGIGVEDLYYGGGQEPNWKEVVIC
jgi:hypothetical protein